MQALPSLRLAVPSNLHPDDDLLVAQLERFGRKLEAADAERRRLADLYQAGLIELNEVQRRAKQLEARRRQLEDERTSLADERRKLAKDNRLRQRVEDFAGRVMASLDGLDFEQRQRLLRLVVEEVGVQGWQVEIALRIPLDENTLEDRGGPELPNPFGAEVSSDMRLRSLAGHQGQVLPHAGPQEGSPRGQGGGVYAVR
jgi:site-specific DNA recombinase